MAVYISRNDICQAAAYKIGSEPITNLEKPETVTEKRLAFLYDRVRRYVLRLGVWNFAQKIKTLAALSGELPEGFANAYEFPSDFIRFEGFVINGMFIVPDTESYMIADGKIYTRGNPLFQEGSNLTIKYISDEKEVKKFDDCFIDAFILRLAYELAYMTTTKSTLTKRLDEEFWVSLTQARMIDGQEQKPRKVCRSKWLTARRAGSSSGIALPYREG